MNDMISVVIPMFNEVDSVPRLHAQLTRAVHGLSGRWEFIFVDDGSRDGTWEALTALAQQDPRVRAVRLKRNFGQTPAMACGIDLARGEVIVTMDGDLQNDPADIPQLLEKLEEGYDVVCGWRVKRQDKLWTRKIPSMIANRLIGWLTGVRLHDYGCSLKAYRAATIKHTPLYAESHRFIPAFSTLTGALVTEIPVHHRARQFGCTKYTLSRTWRVSLDMITVSLLMKFATKPLRFFGLAALGSSLAALTCLMRSWPWYAGPSRSIPQILPASAVLGVWLAGHLAIVGWLAELCVATTHTRPERFIAVGEEQG